MTRTRLVALAVALLPTLVPAAVLVNAAYTDDPRGDVIPAASPAVELGDAAVFAAGSGIDYHTHRLPTAAAVPDDGLANDWTVHVTNTTGQAWADLFFVADVGATVGNADGTMRDLAVPTAGTPTDAFHIDAVGVNANLLWESGVADGVLSPGEQWEFAVINFGTGVQSMPPQFASPGVFAGSSPMGGPGQTNASLLATAVPEPSKLLCWAMAAALTLGRRRRPTPPVVQRTSCLTT